jgi:hypothetical protein
MAKQSQPLFQQPESVAAATSPKGPDEPAGTASTGMSPQQQLAAQQAAQLSAAATTAQRLGNEPQPAFPAQPPESATAATSPAGPDQPIIPAAIGAAAANIGQSLGAAGGTGLGNIAGGGSDAAALAELAAAQQQANAQAAQQSNQSALLTIEQTLSSYGFSGSDLQSLVTFAWNAIVAGTPSAQVVLDIQNQPAFIQEFPYISQRIAAGLPPITPAEGLATKDSMTQTLVAAGINPAQVDLNNLIALDVSPTELSDRIQQGYMVLSTADPDVLNALQNYYGISSGDLVQWATNPAENEQKILQQVAAAQIGGAATQSGFMGANNQNMQLPVNSQLATLLAQQGVSYPTAQSGFANLATQAQLYNPLPGQGQVRQYDTNQLAQAQFEGGPAEQQLQLEAQRQEAYFKAGTGVGTSGSQTAVGPYQR